MNGLFWGLAALVALLWLRWLTHTFGALVWWSVAAVATGAAYHALTERGTE